MFNLSGSEIIVILLLALVILGPEKLPEAMRKAGRAYSELRKMANGFQSEVRSVLDEPMSELRGTADALRDATNFTGDDKSGVGTPQRAARQPAARPQPEADDHPDQAPSTIEDVLGADDHPDQDATDEDLITRTLSGDVAPHDSTDEPGRSA